MGGLVFWGEHSSCQALPGLRWGWAENQAAVGGQENRSWMNGAPITGQARTPVLREQ